MSAPEQTAPAGWEVKRLKDVADIRFSSVDKKSRPGEKPVRLCNYLDAYGTNILPGASGQCGRRRQTQKSLNFHFRTGTSSSPKIQRRRMIWPIPSVFVGGNEPGLVCGYHLAMLRPDKKKVNPVFLAKQIRHHRLARYFGRMSNGLTRYGLPTSAFDFAEVWRPELPEQNAIARVLQDVDEAISQTVGMIEKLRKIKAGLHHDLLTLGIQENGELRDPVRHPEQFTDSPA